MSSFLEVMRGFRTEARGACSRVRGVERSASSKHANPRLHLRRSSDNVGDYVRRRTRSHLFTVGVGLLQGDLR